MSTRTSPPADAHGRSASQDMRCEGFGQASLAHSQSEGSADQAARWPDFFLVGAIKSATTSLYHWLRQHPEVFMPEVKEPTFFGTDLESPNFIRDREVYLELFENASAEQKIGEASPWYLYSRNAAQEIYDCQPEAKILISLRRPVDVMISAHRQQLFNGNEDLYDFQVALAAEARRKDGTDLPPGDFLKEGLFYREVVCFAEQVARFYDVCGKQRVLVLIFDDLVREPRAVFRQVLEFLGVDPGFEPELQIFNPGRRVRSHRLQRCLRHPAKPLRAAIRAVPSPWRRRLAQMFYSLNTAPKDHQPDESDVHASVRRDLDDEVQQLQELLGRDLSIWQAH